MTGIRISDLPLADEPLDGIEFLVGVQNGQSKKITTGGIADIAAGKAVQAASEYTAAAEAAAESAADDAAQTAADRVQTAEDREQAGVYAAATGSDRTAVAADKDIVAADKATANAAAATATEQAGIATTQAVAATSQSGIATTKATEAASSKAAAETARDQAVSAKTASQTAQAASETARDQSVTAKTASQTAQAAAEAVLTNPDFVRVAAGVFPPRVVDIADGTSITMNAATTDIARQDNTQSAGILTINAPTGTPYVGQKLVLRIKSTNIQTLSWNAVFAGSDDLPLPVATSGSSKMDYYGFLYSTTTSKWQLLGKIGGF